MSGGNLVRLCRSLEISGSEGGRTGPSAVLGTLRERFVAADREKSGFLDRGQFRVVLDSLPGTHGLTVGAAKHAMLFSM